MIIKKLNFIVSVSLFVGVVFCNSAFASIALTSGRAQITMGAPLDVMLPRSIHTEHHPLLNTFITPSGNIVQPGQGSQIAPAYSSIVASSGHVDIARVGALAKVVALGINGDASITPPGSNVTISGVSQIEAESINVSVEGDLYLDFSVFSSLPGLFITGNVSFISAQQTSIYMYDNTPNINHLTDLMVFNELPVNYNDEGSVLFFSSQPIINGIFEADNIYIGNYSELSTSAVPLPAAFYFFGSSLFGLAGLRRYGRCFAT